VTDGEETAWLRRRVAELEDEAEIAARLASYDDGGPGAERKYRFIAAEAANFAVTTLCRVTRVSRSAYYAWVAKADRPSPAVLEEARLANLVWDVFWANRRRYGSPRVAQELWRQGIKVNHKTVESLMAALGLQGLCGRRKLKTTRQDPNAAPARDLVRRDFSAAEPNKLLVGDITFIPTAEGYCFLATVLDVCSRRLVGWSLQAHMRASLCSDALLAAAGLRGRALAGATFHSDRGCQYTSGDYAIVCQRLGITQSMGSVGDSYDNAMAESFFSSLKRELVDVSKFSTIAEARLEVFEWVIWYNRKRLHTSLGYLTPEEFEEQFNDQQAA
jgi:transposase InsO family protein